MTCIFQNSQNLCGSPKDCLTKFGNYCLKNNMEELTFDEYQRNLILLAFT